MVLSSTFRLFTNKLTKHKPHSQMKREKEEDRFVYLLVSIFLIRIFLSLAEWGGGWSYVCIRRIRPRFQPSLNLSPPPNFALNSCRALGKAMNPLGLSCTICKMGVVFSLPEQWRGLGQSLFKDPSSSEIYDCLCLYSDWVLTALLLWFSNFLVSGPLYSLKIFEDLKIPFMPEIHMYICTHTHTHIYISVFIVLEIEIKFLWSISLLYELIMNY